MYGFEGFGLLKGRTSFVHFTSTPNLKDPGESTEASDNEDNQSIVSHGGHEERDQKRSNDFTDEINAFHNSVQLTQVNVR